MTRLTHSSGGFLRSMQMSSARIFAFVEGRLDRSFFDRIAGNVCSSSGVRYQIISAKELPGSTGGKPALLATFKKFRAEGKLAFSAFGKKMSCLFIADKDADDYTRRRLRSPHLIYSSTYDLEGHLLLCGNVNRALADACGITIEQSRALIPDPAGFIATAATQWREWVALCLLSQASCVNCGCTFDRASQINMGPMGPVDLVRLADFKSRLASAMQLSQVEFESLYSKVLRRVELSIAQGEPLRYFKGKWFGHIFQSYLEGRPRVPDAAISGVGEKLGVALVGQVAEKQNCCCSAYYEAPFLRALEEVG
jgi:hypothetical protein